MRIGVAGPMTLDLLRPYLPASVQLPKGYPFPMTALLAAELIQRGHEVVAYTTSSDLSRLSCIYGSGLTLCVVPSRPQHRARTFFREEITGIRNAMREQPCDFLHAHWTYEFAIAALGTGLPTLVTVHDSAPAIFQQFRDAYRLVRWAMSAYALKRAPHLSTVSPYLWGTLSGSVRAKTTIIPNFINDSLAAEVPSTSRGRYIITVCNGFSRRKNLSNGLLGFREMLSAGKHIQFLMVGGGCEIGGPVYRFCEKSGCLDNVVFVGPASYGRVLELVGNAMLMLHPSSEESFGMSVLEAMALGTPVIAGIRSGNMPHLIQHGHTGLLCDITSPESIGSSLRTLCSDENLRREMGLSARRHAIKNYSASVVVDQYLEAYQKVLDGHPFPAEAALCN